MARGTRDPAHAGVELVVARARLSRHDRLLARAARRDRAVVLGLVSLVVTADAVATVALC